MYRGYDLRFLKEGYFDSCDLDDDIYNTGLVSFKDHKTKIKEPLNKFALRSGILDGTAIQENWFPKMKYDVFISHSHSDVETAIMLSGVLKNYPGLTSFIDTCVWGYSGDLQRQIDNMHYKIGDNLYSYEGVKFSASHVHMMLSTALMMMIDNCECIFFLDTPNSVSTNNVITKRTQSPWIYSEINISRLIEKRLDRQKMNERLIKSSAENFSRELKFEYKLNMSHFIELTEENFITWMDQAEVRKGKHPLDFLYGLVPPKTKEPYNGQR